MSKDEQCDTERRVVVPYSDAAMKQFLKMYMVFNEREKYCWSNGIDCFIIKMPPDLNAWADMRLTEIAADRGYTVVEKAPLWKFVLNDANTPSEDGVSDSIGGCNAEQLANKLDELLRLSSQLKQFI